MGALQFNRRSSDTHVQQAMLLHYLSRVKVAPINHNRISQQALDASKIERGELFPIGQDQQSISADGGLIGILGVRNVSRNHLLRTLHCSRIVSDNGTLLA